MSHLFTHLILLLVGIIFRGAAFVFRAYGLPQEEFQRRWGRVFAIASILTPIMLGIILGTVAAGPAPQGASPQILQTVLITLGLGSLLLLPAFGLLFHLFKHHRRHLV